MNVCEKILNPLDIFFLPYSLIRRLLHLPTRSYPPPLNRLFTIELESGILHDGTIQ
jgi:hypothetical protein